MSYINKNSLVFIQNLLDNYYIFKALDLIPEALKAKEIPVAALVVEQIDCKALLASIDAELLENEIKKITSLLPPYHNKYLPNFNIARYSYSSLEAMQEVISNLKLDIQQLDEKVIACEHNKSIQLADPTAHAEVLTLRAAAKKINNYRLQKHSLYVTLEPCPMCAGALMHGRVERIIFSARDMQQGACGSCLNLFSDYELKYSPQIIGGLQEKLSKKILDDFFQSKRKKK